MGAWRRKIDRQIAAHRVLEKLRVFSRRLQVTGNISHRSITWAVEIDSSAAETLHIHVYVWTVAWIVASTRFLQDKIYILQYTHMAHGLSTHSRLTGGTEPTSRKVRGEPK